MITKKDKSPSFKSSRVKSKKSPKLSLVKSNLQKSISGSPFFSELLNRGAFKGDYYKYVHFSQESLVLGYKNKTSFYRIDMCISLFSKALKFLRLARRKKNQKFVFVGNPPKVNLESRYIFNKIKTAFFGQNTWRPGFFSKKPRNCLRILVIYDIKTNYIAYNEAVSIKVPVVGFATPNCDIRGLDYPVVINLNNAGLAYAMLCKTLIRK